MNRNQSTSRLRIHELATEVGATPEAVLELLRGQGEKVRDRSTVIGLSAARAVRRHFTEGAERAAAPAALSSESPASAISPQFSAPEAVPTTAPIATVSTDMPQFLPASSPFAIPTAVSPGAPTGRPGPEAAVGSVAIRTAEKDQGSGPEQFPSGRPVTSVVSGAKSSRPETVRPATRPGSRTVTVTRAAAAVPAPPDPALDEKWRRAGIDVEVQAAWLAAGLRPTDVALADQCGVMGIGPAEMELRLAGRTTLQRLRDGEPVPSVWARIEEYRQQPARVGSRLTGRFRQA